MAMNPTTLPPCLNGPDHAVTKGHCWRCGLIIKPPRKKRKPKLPRLRQRDSLPAVMERLVAKHGGQLVEDVLYEVWRNDDAK